MMHGIPSVTEHDHVLGSDKAKVTLVEYGDFECAHCGLAHAVVRDLHARCGDRLRLVFRHFPLSQVHPHAISAALAAEAAAPHGLFWAMHELLFAHARRLTVPDLQTYGAMLGLPPGAVMAALEDPSLRARVRDQFASAVAAGVSGTPSFFVNGVKLQGAWDEGRLERAVVAAIEAADE